MYVLTYTKHRWVPLVSLGFALIGGAVWAISGITLMSFLYVSALQLSLLLPYWRAQVMSRHWKEQLTNSVRLAGTIVARLQLSTGRQELEDAMKQFKGD